MTEKKQKAVKAKINWDAVEPHYRSGIRSLADIGKEFGVSDAGIIKRAKAQGWTRDLKAKIKAKADARVSAAAVSAEVSEQRAANEQQVVEANAELQYKVRMDAREDVKRMERLMRNLLGEIEAETDNLGLFGTLGELLDTSGPDANGSWKKDKMNEIYQKVITSGGRVDSAKKLVEMLEKLIKMKFQVFGIADDDGSKTNIEEMLKVLT